MAKYFIIFVLTLIQNAHALVADCPERLTSIFSNKTFVHDIEAYCQAPDLSADHMTCLQTLAAVKPLDPSNQDVMWRVFPDIYSHHIQVLKYCRPLSIKQKFSPSHQGDKAKISDKIDCFKTMVEAGHFSWPVQDFCSALNLDKDLKKSREKYQCTTQLLKTATYNKYLEDVKIRDGRSEIESDHKIVRELCNTSSGWISAEKKLAAERLKIMASRKIKDSHLETGTDKSGDIFSYKESVDDSNRTLGKFDEYKSPVEGHYDVPDPSVEATIFEIKKSSGK